MIELEKTPRGTYSTNFFSIFINGDFQPNLNQLSEKNLGTFAHEYLHYIQNLTTIYGLRNGIFHFQLLKEVKGFLKSTSKIDLPLKLNFLSDRIKKGKDLFSVLDGNKGIDVGNFTSYDFKLVNRNVGGDNYELVELSFHTANPKPTRVIFGTTCVKESMCHYFQSLFDDKINHDLIPYKSAELLVKKVCPEILTDKRKIISLLLASLSSINPGRSFLDNLEISKMYPKLNGYDLYLKIMNSNGVKALNKSYSLNGFLKESLNQYETCLSQNVVGELSHFKRLFENISHDIDNDNVPIIQVLYLDAMTDIQKLEILIDHYGIPSIRVKDGTLSFPMDTKSQEPSKDIVEFMVQKTVLDRLFETPPCQSTCSMIQICQQSVEEFIEDSCYSNQWDRQKKCMFTIVSDAWELKKKIKTI